mgnify:CR=1 FL=1
MACRLLGLKRKVALTMMLLHLVSTVFESIGIGMILPIVEFLERKFTPFLRLIVLT